MRVISIVNHKGGVGKTTTALNLAAELAAREYKILLVDFDMQGNLTNACGIKNRDDLEYTISEGINEVMRNDDGIDLSSKHKYLQKTTTHENIRLIPCNIRMANTILELQTVVARERRLKDFLLNFEDDFDYCIIDSAPSVMIDFQNAIVASDSVVIVACPNTFSAAGMSSLTGELKKIKRYFNQDLDVTGILLNNVDTRTRFHKDMSELVNEVWQGMNTFKTSIPRSIKVEESQAVALPMREYAPDNPVTTAFSEIADELLEHYLPI